MMIEESETPDVGSKSDASADVLAERRISPRSSSA
jgi:hypothetical protein